MRKQLGWRILFYLIGVNCMALGTTLNSKTGLGLSPVTSLPNSVAELLNIRFSVAVFVLYCLMVLVQFLMKGKNRNWWDLLQLPTSLLFSSYLELFGTLLPFSFPRISQNLLMMVVGTCITGIGVSLSVNMDIAPNPPDGLVYTASKMFHRDMGLMKNILDAICLFAAVMIDMISSGGLRSTGIGTLWNMIFIGRTVSVVDRFFKGKIRRLAGLQE